MSQHTDTVMLILIGDILNWVAAGIVFPLMFLPLAAMISGDRGKTALGWVIIVLAVATAGALFAAIAPILSIEPSRPQAAIFIAITTVLFVIVYAAGGPARLTARLAPVLSGVARGAGRGVMWLLLVMALVQFAVVVLRYVFGVNFIFMQESITYMHGAVFLVVGGYALLTNDHVRVDIFYREAPERRKALIDFLGTYLFLFPICLLLLWTASPYVASSWGASEGSTETSGIQAVYILKSFIPIFAVLLAMAGFAVAARAGETLRGRG